MPTITGTAADDTLTGTEGADILLGNGGFDTFAGLEGDDVIDGQGQMAGGDGNDRFVLRQDGFGVRTTLIAGGAGVDTIDLSLTPLPNSYSGGITARIFADGENVQGVYTLYYYRSTGSPPPTNTFLQATGIERILSYQIIGTTGFSAGSITFDFVGRTTPIEIVGGALAETMRGGAGQDILSGGGGNDTLFLSEGDRGDGGIGDDNLVVSSADYARVGLIDGGAGGDTLTIDLVGAFDGVNLGGTAALRNVENLLLTQSAAYAGQSLATTVVGSAGDNIITFMRASGAAAIATTITVRAGAGADVVTGSGTNDFLYGEAGNDRLTGSGLLDGGDGDDVLTGTGRLLGGAGNDLLTIRQNFSVSGPSVVSAPDSQVIGGDGNDTFQFSQDSIVRFSISLATGIATGVSVPGSYAWQGTVTLSGIENVIGGSGADTIEGDDGINDLRGGRGADIIRGGGGDDFIYGHGMDSTFSDTAGDQLYGEAGNDTIYGHFGSDLLDGGIGDDRLYGGGGNDTLLGGDGNDQLFGEDSNDRLEGGLGADRLEGGAGDDTLLGGAGNDTLNGGAGSDNLDGGDGVDVARFDFSVDLATFTYEGGYIRVAAPGATDTLINVEVLAFNDAVLTVGADGRVSARPAALSGTQSDDVLIGTPGDDWIRGSGGSDLIRGGAGNDALQGGAGNDLMYGGAGVNVLDGDEGSDTAAYSGTLRSYYGVSSTFVGGGAENASDSLVNVEVLRFLDGRLSFDVNDIATATVYRVYDAAFDRAPDVFGLADYVRAINEGRVTLQQMLDTFAASSEFQARYGGLNNEQFVREMYRFSLNREGDAAGVAAYVAALDAGTTTRAQVLGIFSESQEHRGLINAVIRSQGVFIQDEQTASVARLYDSVFDRLPDLGGLKAYRDALDNGYTLKDVAAVLIASPEFQTRFGSLSNQQFVEQIYRFVLDREGDAAGIQAYVQALNSGYSRTDVVLVLSESQEHRFSYQATYDAQIRQLGVNGYDPNGSGVGRSMIEADDKVHDAFVLPAEPGFEIGHHDDAVAVLETAANDHILIDETMMGPWMLTDPLIGTDDLSGAPHRSDWM